jgi:hypothetical protein
MPSTTASAPITYNLTTGGVDILSGSARSFCEERRVPLAHSEGL